jgi:hypothetical protein
LHRAWFPADLYWNRSINPNLWTVFYLASSQNLPKEYYSPPTTLFWSFPFLYSLFANANFIDKSVTLLFLSISFFLELNCYVESYFKTSWLLTVCEAMTAKESIVQSLFLKCVCKRQSTP